MYIWEQANKLCHENTDPAVHRYSEQLIAEVNLLVKEANPTTFVLNTQKLHGIVQKSQLLLFYLNNPSIFEETIGENWLKVVEKDYLRVFLDKRSCFSKRLKESLLYQIEGSSDEATKQFVWEQNIEQELVDALNINLAEAQNEYQSLILKFNGLQQDFNDILQVINSDNFLDYYGKLINLDIHCLYILDSLFLLEDLSLEKYWELTELDFPFYRNDLLNEIDYSPELTK